MADPIPSPVAEPIIPAAAAKWVWLVYTTLALLAIPVVLIWFAADSKVAMTFAAVEAGLGALLRALTTNSFGGAAKMLVVGLVGLALATGATACSAAQKAATLAYFKQVGECSLGSATDQGRALISELDTATKRGAAIDWKAKGTSLGFDVLRCALEALAGVVQNRLEVAVAKNSMGALPDAEVGQLRDQITRINLGRMDLAAAVEAQGAGR